MVREDLITLALKSGVSEIRDLSTTNAGHITFEAANGDVLQGLTYIKNGAVALGMAVTPDELTGCAGPALVRLKKEVGYRPRDKEYLQDKELVTRDLLSFVRAGNLQGIHQLTTGKMRQLVIECANSDVTSGFNYLRNAAIFLLDLNRDEQGRRVIKKNELKLALQALKDVGVCP